MNRSSRPIISLNNVYLSFGGRDVLRNINLDIYKGQSLALMGYSGCGKSTLLGLIAGFRHPTQGTIKHLNNAKQVKGGLVLQNHNLLPWLTILENIRLALLRDKDMSYSESIDRCMHTINQVGLAGFAHYYPREVSGGMRQRACCARALVSDPDIIFLDEPFSSLDLLTKKSLIDDLQSSYKGSMVLVTHSVTEAVMLTDRIILLDRNTSTIVNRISVDFPYPRDLSDNRLVKFRSQLYETFLCLSSIKTKKELALPKVEFDRIFGLLLEIERSPQHSISVDSMVDHVLVINTAQLFNWIHIKNNRVFLRAEGKTFLESDPEYRSDVIAYTLKRNIRLTSVIIDSTLKGPMKLSELEEVIKEQYGYCPPFEELMVYFEWSVVAKIFAYQKRTNTISRL